MITIKNLSHKYPGRADDAIRSVNLHIRKGESLVILGSSGSGKSTLLKCINRLIEPNTGNVLINGEELLKSNIKKAVRLRGKIGMIFQNFNLVENETVLNNVLNGRLRFNSKIRTFLNKFSRTDYVIARDNLRRVGLRGYENQLVMNLSGGQKQRVAIARALSQNPDIILADEPVSSLDPRLMKEVMDLLKSICEEKGITLVTSLHFLEFAKRYATRIVGLREGNIVFDGLPSELNDSKISEIYGDAKNWDINEKVGF